MDLLIALAAIAGLAWGLAFLLRGSLVLGLLVFLLVNSCFGFYFLSFSVGPIPVTLDRLVLLAVLTAYLIQRWMRRTTAAPLGAGDWLLGALIAILTVSTLTHEYHLQTADDISPVWRLVAGYLSPALVYWIARQARLDDAGTRLMYGALTFFGLYLAVTGLLEVAGQWNLVFPRHIADPELGLHFGRARGPMVHSVAYGMYLSACALAACLWLPTWGRGGTLVMVLLLPLWFAAAYFSYTRSVWLGLSLGLTIPLILTAGPRLRPLLIGGLAFGALAVGIAKWDKIVGIEREHAAANSRESAVLRASFAYVSWNMFIDHPLWGVGFGQYSRAKDPYLQDRSIELELEAIRDLIHHNLPLSLLTETGLLGLGLYGAMLAAWTIHAWRLWANRAGPAWVRSQGLFALGMIGIYLPNAVFHELSYMNLVHTLFFFAMGLAAGAQGETASVAAAGSVAAEPHPFEQVTPQLPSPT